MHETFAQAQPLQTIMLAFANLQLVAALSFPTSVMYTITHVPAATCEYSPQTGDLLMAQCSHSHAG